MYYLWPPLFSVGVLQSKDASMIIRISSNFLKPGLLHLETRLFHFGVAWFGIGFQTNIKVQKAVMSSK